MAHAPRARSKGPRRGRPSGEFTQHRRLDRLRETLEAHPSGLTLEELATVLHVTTRSVRRYLEELDRWTQLESIATAPGGAHVWRIKPSERGRALVLRRTQAFALLAARRVFDVMRGSALFDELDVVHRQLVQLAHRPTTRPGQRGELASGRRLEERFVYVPSPSRSYADRGEELDDLFHAVADLHAVRFRHPPRAERHVFHPYALVLHRGRVLCIGRDAGGRDGAGRDAAGRAARVVDFDLTSDLAGLESERFELPDDFAVEDYFDGEFGVAAPAARTRVLIEFDPRVADDVRQRRLHPTQRIATAPDGRIRLSAAVGDLRELTRWVLGFGDAARVIEPAELAAEVKARLEGALARYA